ncbi:MAG: hypothetical protein AB2L14_17910 [Candidatus Xenobiia bacterium LiM19]
MEIIHKSPCTISIHPLTIGHNDMLPDNSALVAQVLAKDRTGYMEVYVPFLEEKFRNLFEKPIAAYGDENRMLEPWSDEAITQIVTIELPRLAFGAIVKDGA